jgi:hypothetical protein
VYSSYVLFSVSECSLKMEGWCTLSSRTEPSAHLSKKPHLLVYPRLRTCAPPNSARREGASRPT